MHVTSENKKRCFLRFGLAMGAVALGFAALSAWPASGGDWMFSPGLYTNDPHTGKPVSQYKPEAPSQLVPYDQYFSADGPDPYGMQDTLNGFYSETPFQYDAPMPARRP